MDKTKQFISTLTPLRGLAAIWVVVFHFDAFMTFGPGKEGLMSKETTMLIGNGYLLVDFFFLLSGFIICHVYGDKLSQKKKGVTKNYLMARFSRLYPLHLFALLFLFLQFAVLSSLSDEYFEGNKGFFPVFDFFVYLFMGQSSGILTNYSWNLPSWSIAAEWWTYIIAIFIIPIINKGSSKITYLFWALSITGLIVLAYFGGNGNLDYTLNFGTLRCLFEFVIGLGIYQVYKKVKDSDSFWKSDWAFYVSLAGSYLFLHLDIHDVIVIVFFSGVILSASLNTGVPYKILNIKPLQFLGDISYSIYLLQLFWLLLWSTYVRVNYPEGIPSFSTNLLMLGILLTALIINSYLTYRFIEIPFQKMLRRKKPKEKIIPEENVKVEK